MHTKIKSCDDCGAKQVTICTTLYIHGVACTVLRSTATMTAGQDVDASVAICTDVGVAACACTDVDVAACACTDVDVAACACLY